MPLADVEVDRIHTPAQKLVGPIPGGPQELVVDVGNPGTGVGNVDHATGVHRLFLQREFVAVARDLVERFETAMLDPTVPAGNPGLFTDSGAAFDITKEVGLAGRLGLNAIADPDQGGQSWRLRDGLGATVPGNPGEARQIQAFTQALTERRSPGSPVFGTGQQSLAGMGIGLMSRAAQNANEAERSLSFAAASMTELTRVELAQGVDTDAELQTLMLVEQAYAANARMIEVADEMLQALLRI